MATRRVRKKAPEQGRKSISFIERFQKFTGLETSLPDGLYKVRKSLFEYQMEWFRSKDTGLYHQRVTLFVKSPSNDIPDHIKSYMPDSLDTDNQTLDTTTLTDQAEEESDEIDLKKAETSPVFLAMKAVIKECIAYAEGQIYTKDPLCGLYLFMGEYSILVVETTEDLMDEFFLKLREVFGSFWDNNKIFRIEDNIGSYYFGDFSMKMAPSIYINEKFTPNTENDPYMMAKQHRIISAKLKGICKCLSKYEPREHLAEEEEELEYEEEDHKRRECEKVTSEAFKKLIPEVQRMDLVLASKRFYPTMDYIPTLQRATPIKPEDDELFWPLLNNYTPANIFNKSKFDYNLTYPESNEAVQEEGQPGILDVHEEEGSEEMEEEAEEKKGDKAGDADDSH